MVDCGGLENRYAERHRGFESYPLRQFSTLAEPRGFEESSPKTDFYMSLRTNAIG